MNRKLIAACAALALPLAACGGDDDSVSGNKAEIADMVVEQASAEGMDLDRDCVEEAVGQISDEDAEKIVEAGIDGDPDVSPEAEAAAMSMMNCIDTGSLTDLMVEQLEASGMDVDRDCVEDAMSEIDGAALAGAADGDLPEGAMTGLLACVDLGG